MHEVNVLWSSPWRDLQQNLANARATESGTEQQERLPPSKSWLGRAYSRQPQANRIVQ